MKIERNSPWGIRVVHVLDISWPMEKFLQELKTIDWNGAMAGTSLGESPEEDLNKALSGLVHK